VVAGCDPGNYDNSSGDALMSALEIVLILIVVVLTVLVLF